MDEQTLLIFATPVLAGTVVTLFAVVLVWRQRKQAKRDREDQTPQT